MSSPNVACRACLSQQSDEQFLDWNATMCEQEQLSYAECFRECTQLALKVRDCPLPETICESCAGELGDVYRFIAMAKASQETLLLKHETTSKQEAYFEWVAVQKDETVEQVAATAAAEDEKYDEEDDLKLNVPDMLHDYEEASNTEEDTVMLLPHTEISDVLDDGVVPTCRKRGRPKTISSDPAISGKHLQCDFCPASFEAKELKRHVTQQHKRQELLCHACPRTFKDASTLRQHAQTHEQNRARNYSCEHCERKFFTKTAYANHAKTHDTNRKAHFQCEHCDKSFFHKGSLKLHMQHHTGETVACKICDKRYLRPIDLEIHLRSHSGDTPFKCRYCEKSFAQVGILNKHVRHHEGYRYKCDICGKEYLHQSTLIQHRKEHTGLPLKCAICNKAFVKRSKLRRHLGGVHKIKELEDMEQLIVKVQTKREYRGRVIEVE